MPHDYPHPTVVGMLMEKYPHPGDGPVKWAKSGGAWRVRTWGETQAIVRAIGAALIDAGLSKGDRVAVASRTRIEWPDADFATLAAGGVVVGVYPSSTAEQVRYVVEHSGARFAFAENDEQAAKLCECRAATGLPERIVVFDADGESAGAVTPLAAFIERGRALYERDPRPLESAWRDLAASDLATIAYTSGTTGSPKGVMITHANLYHTALSAASVQAVDESDFGVAFLPLTHLLQRLTTYTAIHLGMRSAFAESAERIVENLQELHPTVQIAVPRVFEKVYARIRQRAAQALPARRRLFFWAMDVGRRVSALRLTGRPVPTALAARHAVADRLVFARVRALLGGRIKYMVSGGAPISAKLLHFFHAIGITILEGYGLTETVAPATVNRLDDFRFGTVGRVIPGMEIKIAADGEVLLRGRGLFSGYYDDPEATAEAIDGSGWFHTGDIGELDADGFLTITDRKKDLLVTAGGRNVAPQNIENRLKEAPLVSRAMVYGDRRKHLTALITLDADEVRHLAESRGVPYQSVADAATDERVRGLVQRHVDRVNAGLDRTETVKRFTILSKDFSEEAGELTPTLKLRRKAVTKRYKKLLDSMYDETFD